MDPRSRRWLLIGGTVVAVLLVVVVTIDHFLDAATYRGQIESALSRSLGRKVTLGHLTFSLFTGSLVAKSPAVADDARFSNQPFIVANDIRVGIEVGSYLFHRQIHITGLTIDQPRINLLRGEDGTWNYSSLGGGSQRAPRAGDPQGGLLPDLTVAKLAIKDGTLTMGTLPARGPAHAYNDVDVTAQNFSMMREFPFSISGKLPNGGSVSLNGTAGPVDQRDASLTPFTAQLSMKHADLVAAGFVQPEQGVSGVAGLDTRVVSSGGQAHADGTMRVTDLRLAKNGTPSSAPVTVAFSLVEDLKALAGTIHSASVAVGPANMKLSGSYDKHANVTSVQMQAAGQDMPVDALVAFLPSLGVQLPAGSRLRGGTLTTTLQIAGPSNALVISGPVRLVNTQLAGFNLGQKLASIQALTSANTGGDTTIQVLDTKLQYGPGGTRTDNLAVVVAGLGSATGSGAISPRGALDYHLLVKLNAASVPGMASQALAMLPGALGAALSRGTTNGIPLRISGTTANPMFTPELGRMLGGSAQQRQAQPQNPLGTALGNLLGH